MKAFFRKDDSLIGKINSWKHKTNIKSKTFESVLKESPEGPIIATYKIDGELSGLRFRNGKAEVISRIGRVRLDIPVLSEIGRLLRPKIKSGEFVVELYGVNKKGRMLSYPKAIHLLRNPDIGTENRIRIAVIDVIEINGKKVINDVYYKRWLILNQLFRGGNFVHPVVAKKVDHSVLNHMYKDGVLSGAFEGLVLHVGKKTIKVKPLYSQDLAVIGIELSKKHPDTMGALVTAYMDKKGNWRWGGKVGTGYSIKDRKFWKKIADKDKIKQKGRIIYVKPKYVIEVESEELNVRIAPLFDKDLNNIGEALSAIGRKPRFVRIRKDKNINLNDLRLEQIPNWKDKDIDLFFPSHSETLIIKPNKYYEKGLTEQNIWDFYDKVKYKLFKQLKGRTTLLKIQLPGKLIIKRNDKNGRPFQIKSLKDIDRLNSGRTVEWHIVIDKPITKWFWVDIDAHKNYSFKKTKRLAEYIKNILNKYLNPKWIKVKYSGSRGWHILGRLRKNKNVNRLRNEIIKIMEEVIVPRFPQTTTHIAKDDEARLDISTLHVLGSIRAEYSLHTKYGLVSVTPKKIGKTIKTAKKKNFTIKNVLRNLLPSADFNKEQFRFDPNSTQHEGRWRLLDPKKFKPKSYRSWKRWAGIVAPLGIRFIVGEYKPENRMKLQTIRFNKDKWNEKKAAKFWSSIKDKPGFDKVWTEADWKKLSN